MPETEDLERSLPASPKRLEQAREEGLVARSRELSTFVVLMSAVLAFWLMGRTFYERVSAIFKSGLTFDKAHAFDSQWIITTLSDQSTDIFWTFAPLITLIFIAAILSQLLMGGWIFSLRPLSPNFQRMNPIAGIKRMFSLHGGIELGKAIAKALVVGGVAVWVMIIFKEKVLALSMQSPEMAITNLVSFLETSFFIIAGSVLFIVAIDVPFQLWDHSRRLKMTRQELRQEMKESEGDPQIKARIRSQQREVARKRMMTAIPKADVIVTNPTHYAVALSYKTPMRAPKVVAKGRYLLALKIREIADQHKVPVLEAPKLARALYHHVELDGFVPEALYTAVAEVLAYVFQLRAYTKNKAEKPIAPDESLVPDYLDPESETEMRIRSELTT